MATKSKHISTARSKTNQKQTSRRQNKSEPRTRGRSHRVLIVGMHRSGTSMIARLVSSLGVQQLGNRPMSAKSDNQDGFFEDVGIQELNDNLLAAEGCSWSAPIFTIGAKSTFESMRVLDVMRQGRELVYRYAQDCGTPFFIKDPRISLLDSHWRRVLLGDSPTIIALRNPLDVARSLELRNNIPFRHALALWCTYVCGAVKMGTNVPSLLIDYDLAVGRPEQTKRVVGDYLSKSLSLQNGDMFTPNVDVQFRPLALTRRAVEVEFSSGEATRETMKIYRRLRTRHLRSLEKSDANLEIPRWAIEVLEDVREQQAHENQVRDLETTISSLKESISLTGNERSRLEGVLGEERSKSEFLFAEVGVLREQVRLKDVEVGVREAELVGLREQADLERSRLEGVLGEERSKSEFLFAEVGVLREQVRLKDVEVGVREAELVGLREQADLERSRLEGVLGEERSKSEFLFAEVGVLREQVRLKDVEVGVREAELVGLREQRNHLEASFEHLDRQLLCAEAELREQVRLKDVEVGVREAELVGLREQADLERSRLEGVLGEERSKSEFLFAEVGVLREQVRLKDVEVGVREAELVGLREQADLERSRLEGVLGEERSKSEFLFAEVGVRDAELQKIRLQLSAMDRELASLAISTLKNQDAANQLTNTLLENQILNDSLTWAARDIKRLTDSYMYRLRRRIRLLIAVVINFKLKGVGVKEDVIPIEIDPQEYVELIIQSELTEKKLLELRDDLRTLKINPYSHFVARGCSENNCTNEIEI